MHKKLLSKVISNSLLLDHLRPKSMSEIRLMKSMSEIMPMKSMSEIMLMKSMSEIMLMTCSFIITIIFGQNVIDSMYNNAKKP